MTTPDLQPFVKQPLGGIDRRAMVQRLASDGPRVAAADLARTRAALRPVGVSLPEDHVVLMLGGSGGILRSVAVQLLFAEGVAVTAIHYDSEKLQVGYHHAQALTAAAEEVGVGCTFYNNDAARPDVIERVVKDLAERYRVVHLVNGIAAGATKRFAEHGPTRVRELDVAFDPVRQIPDFSSWDNLRKIGLAEVEVATEADIERTYKYMGRSTTPWAEALAAAGLLRKDESLVAFTDYEYEPDDPVYAHGPLCRAKVLQRESLADLKARFGVRTARLCYPAVNTTALGAIPGGILMFTGTAQILRERKQYANLLSLAHDTAPVFSLDHPGGDLRLDLAFQEILPEFHRRKALLTPHNLRENFSLVFESDDL
jgi:enoyl-[acyl-carrier protein] reductase / trans-2-enoyl-CoA reductase (NAD+)